MYTDFEPWFVSHYLCSLQQQELESIIHEGRDAKWPLSTELSSPSVLLDWVQHWSQDSRELILLEVGAKGKMFSSVYEFPYTLDSATVHLQVDTLHCRALTYKYMYVEYL